MKIHRSDVGHFRSFDLAWITATRQRGTVLLGELANDGHEVYLVTSWRIASHLVAQGHEYAPKPAGSR